MNYLKRYRSSQYHIVLGVSQRDIISGIKVRLVGETHTLTSFLKIPANKNE